MIPTKVSYEIMALEVEKLYSKEFPPHDAAITKHCELIAEFIRACGYSEEEYWERWVKENPIEGIDAHDISNMN